MKKADKQKIRQKSADELRKDAQKLKHDIAQAILDSKVNAQKNTNIVSNMKNTLAVTLTVLTEKENEQ